MDRDLLMALRLLQWPNGMLGDRPTYWQIAKRIDASPKMVKMKLDGLRKSGILGGINLVPDVSIFGLQRTVLYISAGKDVIENIWNGMSLLDTVMYLHRYGLTGDSLIIEIIHHDEAHLGNQIQLLLKAFGQFTIIGKEQVLNYGRYKPDSKDIDIIRMLIKNPIEKFSVISASIGMRPGAIKNRIDKMAAENAISIEPIFNSYGGVTPLLYIISIYGNDLQRKEAIERCMDILRDNYIAVKNGFQNSSLFLVTVESFQEITEIYGKLKDMVRNIQLNLIHPFESKYCLPRVVGPLLKQ